ncbi:hypothetical protein EVAR_75205_1 [Eumeta japonica]|uniref:Uncharacterized protein n=1 Tax=Eumeta variegata TaxID=151549 RepID=A0A4C1U0Q5_EUMVA|nr:hypothetical protein EVAR_75205_1 [Eumeta japonica]
MPSEGSHSVSLEFQCSHASPPHDILHKHRIDKEVRHKASFELIDDLTPIFPSERAIDELDRWFLTWRIEVNPNKSAAT